MKIYKAGIGRQWREAGVDRQVADYVDANEGTSPEEAAAALGLEVEQVLWALRNPPEDHEGFAQLPSTLTEQLEKERGGNQSA